MSWRRQCLSSRLAKGAIAEGHCAAWDTKAFDIRRITPAAIAIYGRMQCIWFRNDPATDTERMATTDLSHDGAQQFDFV